MDNLVLYYKPTCPYCRKVLNHMEASGITIPLKDTSSSLAIKDELVKIGGKSQVPCLVINGKAMYESDDIVQWLKTNYKGK